MTKYVIGWLFFLFGIAFVTYGWTLKKRFETLCMNIAMEKGELDNLDSPAGTVDGGLNGYRNRINERILWGNIDESLSADLRQSIISFAPLWRAIHLISAAYAIALISYGILEFGF
jgi:hypothetical protein